MPRKLCCLNGIFLGGPVIPSQQVVLDLYGVNHFKAFKRPSIELTFQENTTCLKLAASIQGGLLYKIPYISTTSQAVFRCQKPHVSCVFFWWCGVYTLAKHAYAMPTR